MSAGGTRPIALGLGGLALAVALVAVARPERVVDLVRSAEPRGIGIALLWAAAVLLARSIRLAVLLAPALSMSRATAVVAVSQCAASILPLRLGELALPPLLEIAGIRGLVRGFAYAVLVRLLDAVALVLWALIAVVAAGTSVLTGAALAVALAGAVAMVLVAFRMLPGLARRWRGRGRWPRTVLRQLLQVRRELRTLHRAPLRTATALLTSVAVWGGLWGLTASLLTAMQRQWPGPAVLAGVIGAAIGSSLPINAVGSFGSLEAGWTAAAAAFGIPAGQALADGFATHLWSLAFSLFFAAPGLLVLLAGSHPAAAMRKLRAALTQRRRNDVAP